MTALMAIASDSGIASPEDCADALSALSDADLLRLQAFAKFRTLGLAQVDPLELLHEAVERALSGRRRWSRAIPFMLFMQGTIRSLAHEHWRRRVEGQVVSLSDLDAGQSLAYEAAPDLTAEKPDQVVENRDLVRAIYALFSEDKIIQAVLDSLAEGLAPSEIMAKTGLSPVAFASLRRKIRRTVDQALAQGKLPDARL